MGISSVKKQNVEHYLPMLGQIIKQWLDGR